MTPATTGAYRNEQMLSILALPKAWHEADQLSEAGIPVRPGDFVHLMRQPIKRLKRKRLRFVMSSFQPRNSKHYFKEVYPACFEAYEAKKAKQAEVNKAEQGKEQGQFPS